MMKKIYNTPNACIIELPHTAILAGSDISKGNTDGQGNGQYDASAKGTSLFFNDTEEEDAPAW